MKKLSTIIAIFSLMTVGVMTVAPAPAALAYDPLAAACADAPDSEVCNKKDEKIEPVFTKIVNTLLFIVGALSTLMIIVAGIMYSVSSGDTGRIAKAKNTLTYSIVGLVVSFIAYAIVNWVLGLF